VTGRLRIVVIGDEASDPPPGIEVLVEVTDLVFAPDAATLDVAIRDAEVIFAWDGDGEMLAHAWPNANALAWIQAASAGVEDLLIPELVESDVILTNARGIFDEPMAEYVLGLVIAFAKDFGGVFERGRRGEWRSHDTERVGGKRMLVAGVGSIGRAIGRAAQDLGMHVRGLGRTARPGDDIFEAIHDADEIVEAVSWADFVVDVLPLTPGTRHLFDARVFSAMQPNARFLNVGRGATVDEPALIEALREGRIAGAALDVFEEEPLPPDSPLWGMRNVIVSPHMSGRAAGWQVALVELFLENLGLFLAGEPLRNVVHKRLGYPTWPRP